MWRIHYDRVKRCLQRGDKAIDSALLMLGTLIVQASPPSEAMKNTSNGGELIMRLVRLLTIGLSCLTCLAACSSDDDNKSSPPEKCELYVQRVCEKALQCKEVDSMSACRSQIHSAVDCSKVVEVSSHYDQCMSDLPYVSCPSSLPTSCERILRMEGYKPPMGGESKGFAGAISEGIVAQ